MKMVSPLESRAFAGLWFSYSISVMATARRPTIVARMFSMDPAALRRWASFPPFGPSGFLGGAVAGGPCRRRQDHRALPPAREPMPA